MKKIERRAFVCLALALLLAAGLGFFLVKYFLDGGSWASSAFNRHLYNSSGQLAAARCWTGTGTCSPRWWTDSAPITTMPPSARPLSMRWGTCRAISAPGPERLCRQADRVQPAERRLRAQRGNDLYLTIDARYNYTAYEALGGKSGTVAVYNYETGEILCMVSAPSYDP